MSIYIKGVEMPPDCLHCFMKHIVRGVKIINGDLHDMWYADCKGAFIATVYSFSGVIEVEGIRSDCPLVELPPHGRLIDVDEASRRFPAEADPRNGYMLYKLNNELSTVIEAEDGEG